MDYVQKCIPKSTQYGTIPWYPKVTAKIQKKYPNHEHSWVEKSTCSVATAE